MCVCHSANYVSGFLWLHFTGMGLRSEMLRNETKKTRWGFLVMIENEGAHLWMEPSLQFLTLYRKRLKMLLRYISMFASNSGPAVQACIYFTTTKHVIFHTIKNTFGLLDPLALQNSIGVCKITLGLLFSQTR